LGSIWGSYSKNGFCAIVMFFPAFACISCSPYALIDLGRKSHDYSNTDLLD
jgi:hypothetical protein